MALPTPHMPLRDIHRCFTDAGDGKSAALPINGLAMLILKRH